MQQRSLFRKWKVSSHCSIKLQNSSDISKVHTNISLSILWCKKTMWFISNQILHKMLLTATRHVYYWHHYQFAESLWRILDPTFSSSSFFSSFSSSSRTLNFFLFLCHFSAYHSLVQLGPTCPNLPQLAKTWLGAGWLILVLVISLSQCTGASWEFALESLKLPFILRGVCCPSEANYCSCSNECFYELFCKLMKFSGHLLISEWKFIQQ